MSDKRTIEKFGFFEGASHEADVAEMAVATGKETAHTNALAQCIALETRDENGKRTLSHISPFDDDNPLHTEDQTQVARYWAGKVLAEHEGAQSVSAILAGGRKGHPLSEQLHDALGDVLNELRVAVRDESNLAPSVSASGRTITSVRSEEQGLKINTYSESGISRRGVSR